MLDRVRKGPGGDVVFCDDIRQENNGKALIIGAYPGPGITVFSDRWPVSIPRLGFAVRYYEEKETFPSFKTISIYLPGAEEPLLKSDIPPQALALNVRPPDFEEMPLRGLNINIALSPIMIPKEGRIRVYISNETERMMLGSIYVSIAPPPLSPLVVNNPPLNPPRP
ncbi:MAG: hypothetical protein WBD42_07260 [Methylovirgula sp.]